VDVSAPIGPSDSTRSQGSDLHPLCKSRSSYGYCTRKHTSTISVRTRPKVVYGDFETDAHSCSATVKQGKRHLSAANVLKVLYKGKPLMEALADTHGLQLTDHRSGRLRPSGDTGEDTVNRNESVIEDQRW